MGIRLTQVTGNILWFWDFLGFCNRVNNHLVSRGIHGHRLLAPIEEFASAFGFAAVETKGELVQVVVQMFVAHGALMGAQQPRLSSDITRWTRINSDADCLCRLTTVT